jgi:hypothetical protein
MSSSIEASSSSLAALSALNSLKRSRVLYDVNPQAAFLPGVDPTILQASINRRKRRVQPQQQQQQTSNALALVSEGMKPLPSSSSALIRAGDATENSSSNSKPTGILVVRFVTLRYVSGTLRVNIKRRFQSLPYTLPSLFSFSYCRNRNRAPR